MKWLIAAIYLFSLLCIHLRGKARLPLRQQLLDRSTLMAPINVFMYLFSRTPASPFVAGSSLPELARLRENWESIRAEAEGLRARASGSAAESTAESATRGAASPDHVPKKRWDQLYLKWYDSVPPSARELCPHTCALLQTIPSVKLATFVELPPRTGLSRHRDPYAGWLRYHLGLATPNDDACYIEVDGQRYSWRDGEAMLFDETYVHSADNGCASGRLVLLCDVERPMRFRWAQAVNHLFGRMLASAMNPPNATTGGSGLAGLLLLVPRGLSRCRRRLRSWSMVAYRAAVVASVTALALLLFAL
jgi:beta-hydroxylase